MTNHTITDAELQAIRSVEQWICFEIQREHGEPPSETPSPDDMALLHGLLARHAPAEDGVPTPDGNDYGFDRDHPNGGETITKERDIIFALLPLAGLPNSVANLVKDAVHMEGLELCPATVAALEKIVLLRDPDRKIPF